MTITERCAEAKDFALSARVALLQAAKRLDDGAHPTIHLKALQAITACDDVVDAVEARS